MNDLKIEVLSTYLRIEGGNLFLQSCLFNLLMLSKKAVTVSPPCSLILSKVLKKDLLIASLLRIPAPTAPKAPVNIKLMYNSNIIFLKKIFQYDF